MKVIAYGEPTEKGILFHYPSKESKDVFLALYEVIKEKFNGYFEVQIEPPKKRRTIRENKKYWAMCGEYGVFMGGMTKEGIHVGIKDRAVAERGYPVEENKISHKVHAKSSAKLSTIEFNILFEVLKQEASENGYVFKEDRVYDGRKNNKK